MIKHCEMCGIEIEAKRVSKKYCEICYKKRRRKLLQEPKKNYTECQRCGNPLDNSNTRKKFCDVCFKKRQYEAQLRYNKRNREKINEFSLRYREKHREEINERVAERRKTEKYKEYIRNYTASIKDRKKEYDRKKYLALKGMKKCPVCNKRYKGSNKVCCSIECYAKYKSNYKTCVVCGRQFQSPPSSKKVTCSKDCSRKRAALAKTAAGRIWNEESRMNLSAKGQTANLKLGKAAALSSPVSGPYETNHNALTWVLQSPDGITYECRNLNLWLRDNVDLLPGTVEQARAGIMQIKRCMEGKTKRAVTQWKGWRLITWEMF